MDKRKTQARFAPLDIRGGLSLRPQFLQGLDVLIFISEQFLLSRTIAGHRELESRTMVSLRLNPDLPPIALNDLLADRQTDSVAGVFGPGVQAMEDDKNIFCILRRNADPV